MYQGSEALEYQGEWPLKNLTEKLVNLCSKVTFTDSKNVNYDIWWFESLREDLPTFLKFQLEKNAVGGGPTTDRPHSLHWPRLSIRHVLLPRPIRGRRLPRHAARLVVHGRSRWRDIRRCWAWKRLIMLTKWRFGKNLTLLSLIPWFSIYRELWLWPIHKQSING